MLSASGSEGARFPSRSTSSTLPTGSSVSIGRNAVSLGYRPKERFQEKPSGKIRVVCFSRGSAQSGKLQLSFRCRLGISLVSKCSKGILNESYLPVKAFLNRAILFLHQTRWQADGCPSKKGSTTHDF